jgi:hypothetical protein
LLHLESFFKQTDSSRGHPLQLSSSQQGDLAAAEQLLLQGVAVDPANPESFTALQQEREMAISAWCSCCSVDKQQSMLQSLHVAASSVVQAILEAGAALDAVDAEGASK